MKILIREGSAAKNFDALISLFADHPNELMFCSDDKHPDDLIEGHINQLVIRALEKGYNIFDVLHAACISPVEHYNLDVGLLEVGDPADFIVVEDLKNFNLIATFIDGQMVADQNTNYIDRVAVSVINNFKVNPLEAKAFQIKAESEKIKVIQAIDGELITKTLIEDVLIKNGLAISNTENDVLKMAVINRYQDKPPALAFIKNFGLQQGAIASCVGHDSHNILVVGVDDDSIGKAVNLIIKNKGGISAVSATESKVLPLPVAGIMSDQEGHNVGKMYAEIDLFVKEVLGSTLNAPFMTLSFMALLVIPELKLSDKGLFDGKTFQFTPLFQ